MEKSEIPLLLALACGLLLNIPQLWRTFKTRDVASFSDTTIVLRVASSLCWVVYALMEDAPLILASGVVTFVSEGLLMVMKQCYAS